MYVYTCIYVCIYVHICICACGVCACVVCVCVQLTLGQRDFELHGSIYLWIFFIKYLCLVIRYWESTDAESPLSAFTAFYIGNLSTCRFLYSWRVLKPISCRYQLSFEGVGSYTQIFNYVGVNAPHPHILQGSTVYTQRTHITC